MGLSVQLSGDVLFVFCSRFLDRRYMFRLSSTSGKSFKCCTRNWWSYASIQMRKRGVVSCCCACLVLLFFFANSYGDHSSIVQFLFVFRLICRYRVQADTYLTSEQVGCASSGFESCICRPR